MSSKPLKTIIYIRKPNAEQKMIYEVLYRLVILVTRDAKLRLVGVLIDSDSYIWQRPLLKSMYESKKIDCIVCDDLSELCTDTKTYLEIMMLSDKGLDVMVFDGGSGLVKIK